MPSKSKPKSTRTLRFETLECRTVPATATYGGGVLSVFGTSIGETLVVSESPAGRLSVSSKVGTNPADPLVPLNIRYGAYIYKTIGVGAASKIFVDGGNGEDLIDVTTVPTKLIQLFGGAGNDVIIGGKGGNELYGRDGNDTLTGGAGTNKYFGELGNDSLVGTAGNDTMSGGDGNDVLNGALGTDSLVGDAGNDTINGGAGNDTATGGSGNDSISGEAGNDNLVGDGDSDFIDGGDGNDSVNGGSGDDEIKGGADNDNLDGNDGNDQISGELGNDTVTGVGGDDSLSGGDGNDKLTGLVGDDSIDGGLANDSLWGGIGNDSLNGGEGNDLIFGEDGMDFVNGDAGNDTVAGGSGTDFVDGGAGDDVVSGSELADVVNGGGGNDTIVSGGGDNGGNNGGNNQNTDPPASAFNSSVHVFQTVRTQWNNGATIDITIRNLTNTTINSWKVEFDADFEIYEQWSAQYLGKTGNHFTFQNNPGTTIGPNQTYTFGFNVNLAPGISRAIRNIEYNDQALTPGSPNVPPPNPNTQGTVTPTVRAQWTNGATIDVVVANTGNTTINGWTIEFDANFELTPGNVWNAQFISRNGNHYTIKSIDNFWNTNIAPNTQVTFGFNVTLDPGDSTAMTNVKLNGNPA